MSPYPNIKDFNIPDITVNVNNLRELWIEAKEPELGHGVSKMNQTGGHQSIESKIAFSTNLRKEMIGLLPLKLKRVEISGSGFTQLADDIFNVIFFFYFNFLILL